MISLDLSLSELIILEHCLVFEKQENEVHFLLICWPFMFMSNLFVSQIFGLNSARFEGKLMGLISRTTVYNLKSVNMNQSLL